MPGPFIVTTIDAATGALFARNPWRAEFGERVAFVDLGGVQSSLTADRTEFLGRYGAVDRPAALAHSAPLVGRVGVGLDPCAALQTRVELEPAAQIDIVFALGDANSCTQAQMLVEKYRAVDVDAVVREARALWDEVLDTAFAPYAQARNESGRAARWRQCAATVRVALESASWDGQGYRRGYYDDGTPLGSNDSSECKIDAIAQSWSVISGAADPTHATLAMNAVEKHLIRPDDKIALLFTPPFDRSSHDPGYIKGYPPGIRENGGQYTHGTIWSIFAFTALGQGDQAGDLFAILNPIHHSSTPNAVARYKVEPYAACADVYSVAPHVGRGGRTWYTGSAGWLYRAGLEAILGFRVHGNTLAIDPCLPKAWSGYEIVFRRRGTRNMVTRYEITVENPRRVSRGVVGAELDGVEIGKGVARIPLVDDGQIHRVRIELG